MLGYKRPNERNYQPLDKETIASYLEAMRKIFHPNDEEAQIPKKSKSFFKAWMETLGTDFYGDDLVNERLKEPYQNTLIHLSETLTPKKRFRDRVTPDATRSFIDPAVKTDFVNKKTGTTHTITKDEVSITTKSGQRLSAQDTFESALLASRDLDMQNNKVTIFSTERNEKVNAYQRTLLQLSILEINKMRADTDQIVIENPIADADLDKDAVAAFEKFKQTELKKFTKEPEQTAETGFQTGTGAEQNAPADNPANNDQVPTPEHTPDGAMSIHNASCPPGCSSGNDAMMQDKSFSLSPIAEAVQRELGTASPVANTAAVEKITDVMKTPHLSPEALEGLEAIRKTLIDDENTSALSPKDRAELQAKIDQTHDEANQLAEARDKRRQDIREDMTNRIREARKDISSDETEELEGSSDIVLDDIELNDNTETVQTPDQQQNAPEEKRCTPQTALDFIKAQADKTEAGGKLFIKGKDAYEDSMLKRALGEVNKSLPTEEKYRYSSGAVMYEFNEETKQLIHQAHEDFDNFLLEKEKSQNAPASSEEIDVNLGPAQGNNGTGSGDKLDRDFKDTAGDDEDFPIASDIVKHGDPDIIRASQEEYFKNRGNSGGGGEENRVVHAPKESQP